MRQPWMQTGSLLSIAFRQRQREANVHIHPLPSCMSHSSSLLFLGLYLVITANFNFSFCVSSWLCLQSCLRTPGGLVYLFEFSVF